MVDPSIVFIDGTHIKASANKKKFQKEQVAKVAKVYAGQLLEEVDAERETLGKKPIEEMMRRTTVIQPKRQYLQPTRTAE